MVFYSKRDKVLMTIAVFIICYFMISTWQCLVSSLHWTVKLFLSSLLVGCSFYLATFLFHTKYVIRDNHLYIWDGIHKLVIPIVKINGIKKTRNFYASPALAFERIEIIYGRKSVFISPNQTEVFIASLRERNEFIFNVAI